MGPRNQSNLYGVPRRAECGVMSNVQATRGGRLVTLACVDQHTS
jgi:hypothetical protein